MLIVALGALESSFAQLLMKHGCRSGFEGKGHANSIFHRKMGLMQLLGGRHDVGQVAPKVHPRRCDAFRTLPSRRGRPYPPATATGLSRGLPAVAAQTKRLTEGQPVPENARRRPSSIYNAAAILGGNTQQNDRQGNRRAREAEATLAPLRAHIAAKLFNTKPASIVSLRNLESGSREVWYWECRFQLKRLGSRRLPAHGAILCPHPCREANARHLMLASVAAVPPLRHMYLLHSDATITLICVCMAELAIYPGPGSESVITLTHHQTETQSMASIIIGRESLTLLMYCYSGKKPAS